MAEEEEEQQSLIYEARNKKVISQKNGVSTVRIVRFLKPLAKQADQAVGIPNTPLLSEIFPQNLQHWPSKVHFKGWKQPQKTWKEWVEILAEKYGSIWNQTGICDAIMSSIYEVRCNPDLVLGLSGFWCPETNTFVFPWGESTITLEDVMILGGYPVLGEPVTSPLTEELEKIEQEMNKQRSLMSRSRAKKAQHSVWLKHFIEQESEFEHVAFLSLWLSRFVFPSLAGNTIGKHVFPIAIHLSKGKQISLAPAVLVSLYRDLRLLREQTLASKESIVVSSPFQLLQLWAFEHFPLLGPNPPNSLKPGEPRIARFHKLGLKINLPIVRSALRVAGNFQWRPYAANLENWRQLSNYEETEQFLSNSSSLEVDLQSFFQCLKASVLVGLDCKEKYLPNRVAMQFGLDQDLPAEYPSDSFNFISENVIGFFVPPRSFQAGVSRRYIKWWKDMMLTRESAIKAVLEKERYGKIYNALLPVEENGNGKDVHVSSSDKSASVVSGCSDNDDDISIARRFKLRYGDAKSTSSSPHVCSASTVANDENNNSAKRKLRTAIADGVLEDEEVTKKPGDFVAEKVKKEFGCSINEPIDVEELIKEMKDREKGRNAAECGSEVRKRRKAGESLNNPIDVDNYMDITTSGFPEIEQELQGRVEKLEKLLGVVPD